MKKLVFRAGDFMQQKHVTHEGAANSAQHVFNEWFEKEIMSAPVFYGFCDEEGHYYGSVKEESDTHTARLIDIQEIKKDCKHEPIQISITNLGIGKSNCKNCGAVLVAEWKTK